MTKHASDPKLEATLEDMLERIAHDDDDPLLKALDRIASHCVKRLKDGASKEVIAQELSGRLH